MRGATVQNEAAQTDADASYPSSGVCHASFPQGGSLRTAHTPVGATAESPASLPFHPSLPCAKGGAAERRRRDCYNAKEQPLRRSRASSPCTGEPKKRAVPCPSFPLYAKKPSAYADGFFVFKRMDSKKCEIIPIFPFPVCAFFTALSFCAPRGRTNRFRPGCRTPQAHARQSRLPPLRGAGR